jgi:hypothetical protein
MANEFRDLFERMYNYFPNGRISEDVVHRVIVTNNDRKFLVKHGFLIVEESIENGKRKKYYNIGPNALQLIISWKTEKLTYLLVILTVLLVFLSIILLIK